MLPKDATPTEKEIWRLMTKKVYEYPDTFRIYKSLENITDMFLVAYVYELGYTRLKAAELLHMGRNTLWDRMKRLDAKIEKFALNEHLLLRGTKL